MARYTKATVPEGIKVQFRHFRNKSTGRIVGTNCYLYRGDEIVASGSAVVSEREKCPSKKIGRAVSLGRALKEYANGNV